MSARFLSDKFTCIEWLEPQLVFSVVDSYSAFGATSPWKYAILTGPRFVARQRNVNMRIINYSMTLA